MKKLAGPIVFLFVLLTYFLSSIPGLAVLPIFRQVNIFLQGLDISVSNLIYRLIDRLPAQLAPAQTLTQDFLNYARANPVILEFILRKLAHVVLFFFITLALYFLIRKYFRSPWVATAVTFVAGTVVAVLDEYHQSMVPGRAGTVVDVVIDMVGVSAATLLIVFALLIARHYQR